MPVRSIKEEDHPPIYIGGSPGGHSVNRWGFSATRSSIYVCWSEISAQ
ncbi:MAG: hypothetical protein ACRCUY_05345 [Thermoguttaceae bacterium]